MKRYRPLPVRTVFGPPSLIHGENPEEYNEIVTRISVAVRPSDIIEEIYAGDLVNFTWDIERLRRAKAKYLDSMMPRSLRDVLFPIVAADYGPMSSEPLDRADVLSRQWAARKPDAVAEVDKLLASAGLGMDVVVARTIVDNIGNLERIDRSILLAAARRDGSFRELEKHRAASAARLRRETEVIAEADFEIVKPQKRLRQ